MYHHSQILFLEFLFKFSDHLLHHFHKINIIHLQFDVSCACLGCLYHILCEHLQSLGFLIQDAKIFLYFRICRVLTFHQIYIINNGSQRCFQIMGNICDQLCLHSFFFQAVLYSSIQTTANIVDIFCHHLLFSGKCICFNLILQFSIAYFLQTIHNKIQSVRFSDDKNHSSHIYSHQCQQEYFCTTEYATDDQKLQE